MPNIIGLEKPIEDPKTGAQPSFHVARLYQVDMSVQRTMIVLASYVSRAAYEGGKAQITSITVSGVQGEPSGDSAQWCYAQLLAPGVDHVLSGAVPAYAEGEAE